MACFLVPTAEAVVVGVVKKVADSKKPAEETAQEQTVATEEITLVDKLGWLIKMLVGGAVLLAYEHLWHGEVVPFPPFLTAMNDPGDTTEMLHEMGTVGVTMAVIITVVWGGMVAASSYLAKKKYTAAEEANA